jgi:hypothetical protein
MNNALVVAKKHWVSLLMVSLMVLMSASPVLAQATPNFTLDFTQAETDFKAAATSVLAFTLVIFGFYAFYKLVKNR